MLQDPNRDVSVGKAQPLQQESPCHANAHLVRAPGLKTVSSVLLDQGKALTGRFVKVLPLLNLLEYPYSQSRISTACSRQEVRLMALVPRVR